MFDALVDELSQRYGLGDRSRDLFGLLMAYVHNDRRGGFNGFVESFREQGKGDLVSDWLGNPEAGGLNPSDVGMVFGQGLLSDWGTRLGVSRATVTAAIAGVLPRMVAELTPGGRIPGGFGQALATGAPPPLSGLPTVRPPVSSAKSESFSVRPGVEGLFAERAQRDPGDASRDAGIDAAADYDAVMRDALQPKRDEDVQAEPDRSGYLRADDNPPGYNHADGARSTDMSKPLAGDPGRIVPGQQSPIVGIPPARGPADFEAAPLRREPVFVAAPPPMPVHATQPNALGRTPVEQEPQPPARVRDLDPAERRIAEMAAAFDPPDARGQTSPPPPVYAERPEGWRPAAHAPKRRRGFGWLFWLIVLLAIIAGAAWYAWSLGLLEPYIRELQIPVPSSPSTL